MDDLPEPASPSQLPVSASGEASAHHRAPTLMAGETPGQQGQVELWSPSPKLIRLQLTFWTAVCGLGVGSLYLLLSTSFWTWLLLTFPLWLAVIVGLAPVVGGAMSAFYAANAFLSLPALWRPSFITADDAGIGVTTWRGSRAVRWDQIIAYARYRVLHYVIIYLDSGKVILVNSSGYPRSVMDEFCATTAARAHLEVHDRTRWRRLLFCGSYSGRFRKGYRLAFSDEVVRIPEALPPERGSNAA